MAKENLEDLSIEMLKKKKKNSSFLLGVMIGIMLVDFILLGISIAKGTNVAVLVSGLVLVFFTILLYSNINKIDLELSRDVHKF